MSQPDFGIERFKSNPILTKEDVPFRVNSIFNAGAVMYNNEYLLVCRVEMPNGRSSFVLAKSTDGYNFEVDEAPCLTPQDHAEFLLYVNWGIEDTRITQFDNTYYLTYTGYSKYSPLVILAETNDFQKFHIHGPITEPSNKDAVLFPEKIDNFYFKLDRPSAGHRTDIWISRSRDLLHWGGYAMLMEPEAGTWEHERIGTSTPPIRTEDGWLLLYHGARILGTSTIYKLGVLLLDLEKPWIVISKSKEPILSPEYDYERVGDVGNVVFSNGWVVEGNQVMIYYSGADTNICLAQTTVNYLLSTCR